jgi:hypothetical protein
VVGIDIITFCSFDVISLVVQAVGGGIASTANDSKGATLVIFFPRSLLVSNVLMTTSGWQYHAWGDCVPIGYVVYLHIENHP